MLWESSSLCMILGLAFALDASGEGAAVLGIYELLDTPFGDSLGLPSLLQKRWAKEKRG